MEHVRFVVVVERTPFSIATAASVTTKVVLRGVVCGFSFGFGTDIPFGVVALVKYCLELVVVEAHLCI